MGNKALVYDGTAYTHKDSSVSGIGGATTFTVEAWFKRTAINNYDAIWELGDYGNWIPRLVVHSTNYIYFQIGDNGAVNYKSWKSTNTFTDTASWHHIMATYSAGTIAVYLDGAALAGAIDAGTYTGVVPALTTYLSIGGGYYSATGWGLLFHGMITEVRVANVVREEHEAYAAYQGGVGMRLHNDGNTAGLWHCNEGTGTTIDDTTGTNDLTATNTSWDDGLAFPTAPYTIVSQIPSNLALQGHGDIARMPNGDLLIAYVYDDDGTSRIIKTIRSTDNGTTWSGTETIYDETSSNLSATDAQMSVIGSRIFITIQLYTLPGFTWKTDGIEILYSDDNGENWTDWGALDSSFTTYAGGLGRIISLTNGTLVIPFTGRNSGDSYSSIHLMTSANNGSTWGNETLVADGETDTTEYEEPFMICTGGTNVLCLIRNDTGGDALKCTSTDSGATWSAVSTAFVDCVGRPTVEKTVKTEQLICVYRRNSAVNQYQKYSVYRTSDDSGASWNAETAFDSEWFTNQYGGVTTYRIGGTIYKAFVYFAGLPDGTNQAEVRFWLDSESTTLPAKGMPLLPILETQRVL